MSAKFKKHTVDIQKIDKIFTSFAGKKILIIGDVMLDAYLWGDVDRISPEAPVQIVSCTQRENRIGGAANVALNIKSLGAVPVLCSVIGNDEKADVFLNLLEQNNLETSGIIKINNRKTTVKTRIISRGQQILRVDEEDISPIDRDSESKLIRLILKFIESENIEAVIFEDYDKGTITPRIINEISEVSKNSILTLVDPKKRNFEYYKNCTLFKPNFKEFTEGLNISIKKDDYQSLFNSAKEYLKENDNKYLMITLSEKGIFLANREEYFHVPAQQHDIIDVSGAGDTVISVACLCLLSDIKPIDMLTILNIAGGIVCQKTGVVPIEISSLKQEILHKLVM